MKDDYYFSDVQKQLSENYSVFTELENYANSNKKQVYVLQKALSTNNVYNYNDACAILIPNCKILIINLREKCSDFDNYYDDFIEDLGHLSDKFSYKEVLGRPREWKDFIKDIEINRFSLSEAITEYLETDPTICRKIELLSSLLIGSINDINRIGKNVPMTTLDKVKQKIVLYDGTQSNFIYKNDTEKKQIRIQGLAGTGKTELLLHKIREVYVKEPDSRIVFTCYNRVLEEDMLKRIPTFFNFMKVEEQIEWNQRLWVMRSWGASNNQNTGVYSYICASYDIPFRSLTKYFTFDEICKEAVNNLKEKYTEIIPCFDYMFIDESQDFGNNFFELCSLITKKQIFIAGDVFQNIFDTDISSAEVDYILNRCYRTDPKTLMFAHSVGMGLYEKPTIRWLEDNEWETCGYIVGKKDEKYTLTRNPIRRFEDIPSESNTVIIKKVDDSNILNKIKDCICEIRRNNEAVIPDDIAIIFLQRNMKTNCEVADQLTNLLWQEFEWETTKGYETKQRKNNTVFISNINNIKGLEFPFIICIAENYIGRDIKMRNSIYMALTRSFINSYFIINNANSDFIQIYSTANASITENQAIIINEPTTTEKEESKAIIARIKDTQNDRFAILDSIAEEYNLSDDKKQALKLLASTALSDSKRSTAELTTILKKIVESLG